MNENVWPIFAWLSIAAIVWAIAWCGVEENRVLYEYKYKVEQLKDE